MSQVLVQLKSRSDMSDELGNLLGDGFEVLQEELLGSAGEELYPMGVIMLFANAMHLETQELSGIDNPFGKTLMVISNSVFEAIIDGDATAVTTLWESTLAEFADAQAPVVKANAEMDYKHFEAVHRLATIVHYCAEESGYTAHERRDDGVNPYYNQLQDGIIVEFYYGHPSKIYTPLGEYNITGGGGGSYADGERYTELFMNHPDLEVELFEEERVNRMGHFGPWYAIRRIGRMDFAFPIKREKEAYVPYEDAKELWEQLSLRYLSRHFKRDGFWTSVKKYPDSKEAKKVAGQRVDVKQIHRDGTASVFTADVFRNRSGVAIRIPLTDLKVFEEKKVK